MYVPKKGIQLDTFTISWDKKSIQLDTFPTGSNPNFFSTGGSTTDVSNEVICDRCQGKIWGD